MALYELDVKRLLCPMPVIKTQHKVNTLDQGDELIIYATDPGAMQDIPAWCRVFGHTVVFIEDQDDLCKLHIRVGGSTEANP